MYGLIGEKLTHSFSARFFAEKFEREGIKETYRLFPIPSVSDFLTLIQENNDLKGLNVTIPYKQEVIPFLNDISEEAAQIGAVNVIKITRTGDEISLKGYNSDCIGFEKSLRPLLRNDIKKALILGTGGASKAVAYVLGKLGIEFTFVSRNPKEGQLQYNELDENILGSHLLIINTTPLGTWPDVDSHPPLPYQFISPEHVCYDLVYNPEITKFLSLCKEKGATVKNGFEMLELQALASWDIWNGKT